MHCIIVRRHYKIFTSTLNGSHDNTKRSSLNQGGNVNKVDGLQLLYLSNGATCP